MADTSNQIPGSSTSSFDPASLGATPKQQQQSAPTSLGATTPDSGPPSPSGAKFDPSSLGATPKSGDGAGAENSTSPTTSMAKPGTEEDVGSVNHAIMGLFAQSPTLQQKYLDKQGYDSKVEDGKVLFRTKGKSGYTEFNPTGVNSSEILDHLGEDVDQVAQFMGMAVGGTAGAAVAGPVGAIGGAGIGAGAAAGIWDQVQQHVQKYMGLQDDISGTQTAVKAGVAAGFGAVGGLASRAPTEEVIAQNANAAAVRAAGFTSAQAERMGPKIIDSTGQYIRDNKLAPLFKSARAKLDDGVSYQREIGQKLEKAYQDLSTMPSGLSKIPYNISRENLVTTTAANVVNKLDNTEAGNIVKKAVADAINSRPANMIKDKASGTLTKPNLSILDMHDVSMRLDDIAHSFDRIGGTPDQTKAAGILRAAASDIRDQVGKVAEAEGIPTLRKLSQEYSQVSNVVRNLRSSWAKNITSEGASPSQVASKSGVLRTAISAVDDIVSRSVAPKASSAAAAVLPIASKAGSSGTNVVGKYFDQNKVDSNQ